MSCNHCQTKFNFFHKEMGCSSCGLSFCSRCLKQKCKIPGKSSNENMNVCKLCFTKLSNNTQEKNIIIPPETFLKRLEALENPAAPPITIYKHNPQMESLKKGLSDVDLQLVNRLEKLKDYKGPPPTEAELRCRLASLKGENDYVEGPSRLPTYHRIQPHTADSLLEQFVNEENIELSHNPQQEIEARLATLREKGVRPNEGPFIKNLHDSSGSEEEINMITKKIMDEVALDERCPVRKRSQEEEMDTGGSPELPWCVLCNNDAQYRCYDCSGDLYCSECNREVHKKWGDTDHKVVAYKPPT